MARLSKEEHDGFLSTLSEMANASPEALEVVDKLRADYDESMALDFTEVEAGYQSQIEGLTAERDQAIAERDDVRRVYRERFFSSTPNAAVQVENPKSLEDLLRGGR